VGETGQIFYVGRRFWGIVEDFGDLYLRIDDDIVSDNVGALEVRITVVSAEKTRTPSGD